MSIFTYKTNTVLKYKIKTTLPEIVAAYLDVEHFDYLHDDLVEDFQVHTYTATKIIWSKVWKIFTLPIRVELTTEYDGPSSFLTIMKIAPNTILGNIFKSLKVTNKLIYFETNDNSILSDSRVEIILYRFLWPFEKIILNEMIKLKTILDLEDVAMLDRKAYLIPSAREKIYTKKNQFLLFKETYNKFFLDKKSTMKYSGKHDHIPFIKELDKNYVKKFISHKYKTITGFENDEV